jgi:hypothetical protein
MLFNHLFPYKPNSPEACYKVARTASKKNDAKTKFLQAKYEKTNSVA